MRFPDTLHAAGTAENKQTKKQKQIVFFTVHATTTNTSKHEF